MVLRGGGSRVGSSRKRQGADGGNRRENSCVARGPQRGRRPAPEALLEEVDQGLFTRGRRGRQAGPLAPSLLHRPPPRRPPVGATAQQVGRPTASFREAASLVVEADFEAGGDRLRGDEDQLIELAGVRRRPVLQPCVGRARMVGVRGGGGRRRGGTREAVGVGHVDGEAR